MRQEKREMIRNGYDIPEGGPSVIIGGNETTATLHRYDTGAQQGPQFIGDTDREVITQAKAWFLANNKSGDGRPLWPNGLELRIRG